MKIVHVITDLMRAGAEIALYNLLSKLNRSGFDCVVVSLKSSLPLNADFAALGVPVYSLGMRPPIPSPWKAARLAFLVRTLKADLVHGWMYHGNVAAQFAATFCQKKTPVLWSIRHALYDLQRERPMTQKVIRWGAPLSRRAAAVLYNSHASALLHERLGYCQDRTIVVPNGIDCDVFRPDRTARDEVRRELCIPSSEAVIGLVARFHADKAHENFLTAAGILRGFGMKATYVLIGKNVDSTNQPLVQKISELGLRDCVRLLGEREDLARLTAALDIAASASRTESFSNAILEAMACGVPCVVTDVGDSARIIGEGGVAVPPNDPQGLAGAWKVLLDRGASYRSTLGQTSRSRAERLFSLSEVAKLYEQIYRSVAAGIFPGLLAKRNGSCAA